MAPAEVTATDKPPVKSRYIPWAELVRRTFGAEIVCPTWHTQLRLIAIVKSEEVIKKILVAMHLPAQAPELHSARPPPGHRDQGPGPSGEDRAS